jgi:DNA-binding NtrC family response regulator
VTRERNVLRGCCEVIEACTKSRSISWRQPIELSGRIRCCAIHDHGPRKEAPFIAVNIAALAPTLVESELFGHEKGAFSGASERRAGRFEVANGGTLFLDEVGDLEMSLQTKLLCVLQDGSFERVGATTPLASNACAVAATSKPVQPGADGRTLRGDLFIGSAFCRSSFHRCASGGATFRFWSKRRAVSEAAMERLRAQPWPGNVRELMHVLERAAVMSSAEILDETDSGLTDAPMQIVLDDDPDLRRNVHATERRLIERALVRANGNRAEAARLLGIARPQLYAKMRDLGLKL